MLRGEFERLQNPPTNKDAAGEQLPLKIKDLTREYRIARSNRQRTGVACKSPECSLNIGYCESKGSWTKIKKWCEAHTPTCKFTTAMKTLPRPLVNKAVKIAIGVGILDTTTSS